IELRVGINTGEALVTYGGEPLAAGDVVNTAARLQSAAPVNGILVGQKTYEATKHAIDYGKAEPVAAKGKSAPVAVRGALEAGVLEGDSADEATAKLNRAVTGVIADDDAGWVERHLRPLVGAGGDGGTGDRGEAFAAWRRFVEALAEHHPTVLIFEDLQWADD